MICDSSRRFFNDYLCLSREIDLSHNKTTHDYFMSYQARREQGEGVIGVGCPLLLWKFCSQLSSIFSENIAQIFSNAGRK